MTQNHKKLIIIGAHEHNLKYIDVEIQRNSFTVITGVSGSGKSSLAFDTIYAEGQRRYIESLSAYARQFLDQLPKPKVELITGLSPAISIEQRTISHNPRSTVGTVTEIYDYLRLLFAHLGKPFCPKCGKPIERQNSEQIIERILTFPDGTKLMVMAPIVRGRKGEYSKLFDQLQREGFTRVLVDGKVYELGEPIKLKKTYKHNISLIVDRLILEKDVQSRLHSAIELALKKANGLVEVEILDSTRTSSAAKSQTLLFSERFSCLNCGETIAEISPRLFSFNSPYGACPQCKGLGTVLEVEESLVVEPSKSVLEGALRPWESLISRNYTANQNRMAALLQAISQKLGIDLNKPFSRLSKKNQQILLYGAGDELFSFSYRRGGKIFKETARYQGVIPYLQRRLAETSSESIREEILNFYADKPCPSCKGTRLRPESLAVKFQGKNIAELARMPVKQLLQFFSSLQLTPREFQIGEQILKEIKDRLEFLHKVGLNYLDLDRRTETLAGGEAQRTKLATQIGTQLVGVLYILDEPSIGLHPRDNLRLIETLKHLQQLGNTIIVVEHDESTIRAADYVVDLGPGAGSAGGYLVIAASPQIVASEPRSLTGRYLSGTEKIPLPQERRKPKPGHYIKIIGAAEHNLKNIDVEIPLGLMVCVTGVSGSGKSTLILDVLYKILSRRLYGTGALPGKHKTILGIENIDKVINVDQSPIGRTARSNPATYTGLFTHIRDLFAMLPAARMRGYTKSRFSFNLPGGRCERCQGHGTIKVEMQFLPDVYLECEECGGQRYNAQTLEVTYHGKSIADVLSMTVTDALNFFANIPPIREKLELLNDVDLGYITLGQPATTLSGGEAQRIKLTRELGKKQTGRTLYILDEPTTGLHFADIKKLLQVLNRLVDLGNTVIVIEHNLEVIKCADWIIDLGPEGGDEGGYVIASAPPEQLIQHPTSYTARYLKEVLQSQ